MTDSFTPCNKTREATIRECIDALPTRRNNGAFSCSCDEGFNAAIQNMADSLQSLLPKPDPVKALVEEWVDSDDYALGDQSNEGFARWLITTKKVELP